MEFLMLMMGVLGGALIGWALALQGWHRDVTPTPERMERAGFETMEQTTEYVLPAQWTVGEAAEFVKRTRAGA